MPDPFLSRMLARCFLAGEPAVDPIVERCSRALGRRWRWLQPLAERYLKAFAGRTRPRRREVAQFLLHDRGFQSAWSKYLPELFVAEWLGEPQTMQPVEAAAEWDIPRVESTAALAGLLGLKIGRAHV